MIITKKFVNDLSYEIVGAAIEVNKYLGPGLLESVYEKCLIKELEIRGLKTTAQKQIENNYKGIKLNTELRSDIIVEDLIIVENKAVEKIIDIYKAQLLTYLKLLNLPKGLLINFNTTNITKDLVPLVTERFALLPDY